MRLSLFVVALLITAFVPTQTHAEWRIGASSVDVTPKFPVRLSGFGFRRAESEGITQKIWAKALAVDDGQAGLAVLVTVDNLGVPWPIVQTVSMRLREQTGLAPERFTVTATHTHTAPMLSSVAPTLFGQPIPLAHQRRIDLYTEKLTDWIEQAALDALDDLEPGRLEWSPGNAGQVGFAKNRRTKDGPVDHDLPVLIARTAKGDIRAIYTSYACHCVTLSNNKISGDWAGYAQDWLQKNHSGAVAMVSIGCGADQNPDTGVTGDNIDAASAQGRQIADEVSRRLKDGMTPLAGSLKTTLGQVELDFDTLPTKGEWERLGKRADAVGYHARVQLARLARNEALQTRLDYPIQTWRFAGELAMVFLPGEVVVDYSLRLKREFDRARLWINAYSNDAPCYIPSERILREGGYEGAGAMVYYDRPTKLAAGLEDKIVSEIHRQLPETFRTKKGTEGTNPQSPGASLRSIRVRPGLRVELVASEPLVIDPVSINFGPDGRIWVVEMHDYPLGLRGGYEPGGRIVFLDDTDRDGFPDKRTVFLEGLPFPTGVTPWRKGFLVCAAPEILYAEDTDGDGQADVRRALFSGFATTNYQARVNSLGYGLDGWVHGSNGLIGGQIVGFIGGQSVDIRGRDFRFNPDTGAFETLAGLTQHGRVRDDWGNWFGCDNGTLLRHYPLVDHYLRRNPYFSPPSPSVAAAGYADANRVFPISEPLERFNHPSHINRVTSACGLGLYRDTLLGNEFYGDAFICEPVHNLVRRLKLRPNGVTFSAHRPEGKTSPEFLASTDNWFRPVEIRTGPEGGLWVVDMYRFLVEHPRWIQPERLAGIDSRAGSTRGRIYRVLPNGKKTRPVPDLTRLSGKVLVKALESPNGTLRELAQQQIVWTADKGADPEIRLLARSGGQPQTRVQALAALAELGSLTKRDIEAALSDPHPAVRRHAVRLAEGFAADDSTWVDRLAKLVHDPDPFVRQQLAYSLGQSPHPNAAQALIKLLHRDNADLYQVAAILSSSLLHITTLQKTVLGESSIPDDVVKQVQQLAKRIIAKPEVIRENKPANLEPVVTTNRTDALKRFADVTMLDGNAEKGRIIFKSRCSACHKLSGIGNSVGPDLAALTDKSEQSLLVGTIDPNREVSEQYTVYSVRLKNGTNMGGMIADESANGFMLRGIDGKQKAILRADIASLSNTGRSLMPEGLEAGLSVTEMADLLAFISKPN
ncbi:MAG: neutral/alkaline non-lysosomal ceramidase N-terminal domain-containing protein [Verrucomicrobiota bacterium]|nr:neutral/alkaline non-lysosomal ceramidase N-terminal domain-containing protein [Verrucomicrobiota bacterium]